MTDAERATINSASTIGDEIQKLGRLFSVYLTVPIVALGTKVTELANIFELELSRVEGLIAIPREQVQAWSDDILNLAGVVGQTPEELAKGMFASTTAGQRGAAAMQVLTEGARSATAGLGDTKTVIDAITSAVNAYRIENLSASRANDILTATIREGKLEASGVAGIIGRVLPMAAAMKISFEEIGGTMAVLSRTGMKAAEASVAIQAIMSTLSKPSMKARKLLAGVNISFQDLRNIARGPAGIIEVMRLLESTFEGNEEALSRLMPNIRALRGGLNILAQEGTTVDAIMQGVRDSTGAADHAFEVAAKTISVRMKMATSKMKAGFIELGKSIGEFVLPFFDKLASIVSSAGQWWRNLDKAVKKVVLTFTAVVASAGPAMLLIWAVGPAALSAMKLAAAGIVALGLRLITILNPVKTLLITIGAVGAALKGLAWFVIVPPWVYISAGAVALVRMWDDIVAGASGAWKNITQFAKDAFAIIKLLFFNLGEIIGAAWEGLKVAWRALDEAVTPLINKVKELATASVEWVKDFAAAHEDLVGIIITTIAVITTSYVAYRTLAFLIGMVTAVVVALNVHGKVFALVMGVWHAAVIVANVALGMYLATLYAVTGSTVLLRSASISLAAPMLLMRGLFLTLSGILTAATAALTTFRGAMISLSAGVVLGLVAMTSLKIVILGVAAPIAGVVLAIKGISLVFRFAQVYIQAFNAAMVFMVVTVGMARGAATLATASVAALKAAVTAMSVSMLAAGYSIRTIHLAITTLTLAVHLKIAALRIASAAWATLKAVVIPFRLVLMALSGVTITFHTLMLQVNTALYAGKTIWAALTATVVAAKSAWIAMGALWAVVKAKIIAFNAALAASGIVITAAKIASLAVSLTSLGVVLGVVGIALWSVYKAGKAAFQALGNLPNIQRLSVVGDMFVEWRDLLADIVDAVQIDMTLAWDLMKASARLAVAQVKALFPPFWKLLADGFVALWELVGSVLTMELKRATTVVAEKPASFFAGVADFFANLPIDVTRTVTFGLVDIDKGPGPFTDPIDKEMDRMNKAVDNAISGAVTTARVKLAGALAKFTPNMATEEIKEALDEVKNLQKELGRLRELKGTVDPDLFKLPDTADAIAEEFGSDLGKGITEGVKKEIKEWDAVGRFSAAGIRRIAEHIDMLRGGGDPTEKRAKAAEEQTKRQAKAVDDLRKEYVKLKNAADEAAAAMAGAPVREREKAREKAIEANKKAKELFDKISGMVKKPAEGPARDTRGGVIRAIPKQPMKIVPPKIVPPKIEPPQRGKILAAPPRIVPPKIEPPKIVPPKIVPPKMEPPKMEKIPAVNRDAEGGMEVVDSKGIIKAQNDAKDETVVVLKETRDLIRELLRKAGGGTLPAANA